MALPDSLDVAHHAIIDARWHIADSARVEQESEKVERRVGHDGLHSEDNHTTNALKYLQNCLRIIPSIEGAAPGFAANPLDWTPNLAIFRLTDQSVSQEKS